MVHAHAAIRINDDVSNARVNLALKRGVEAEKLVQVKGSFRLPKGQAAKKAPVKGKGKTVTRGARKAKSATSSSTGKMTTLDLIKEAIQEQRQKGSRGVSRHAIKQYIGDKALVSRINTTLKTAVEKEYLIKHKDAFRVNKDYGKEPSTKPKTVGNRFAVLGHCLT